MIPWVEIFGALAALTFLFIAYRKWSFSFWSRQNVPSLPPNFIWGSIENPFNTKRGLKMDLKYYYDEMKKRGHKHGGMYLMTDPVYMPVDLDLIKSILSKDFNHFISHGVDFDAERDPLSANIFNLERDDWRHMRVKLTPTFTSGKLKTMFNTLLECGHPMLDHIDDLSKKHQLLDVKEILASYTTDVIGSCAFGLECNSFKDPNAEFRTYGRKVFEPSLANAVKMAIAFVLPQIKKLVHFNLLSDELGNFFTKVVRSLIEYRTKNNVKRRDFIQLFLEMNEKARANGEEELTLNQIVAQSIVFFLGGFETSSATMSFVLHELAFNQDIQDRIREEVREAMKRHDGKLTYDGIMEMKYLDLVVHETLRKFPIVPFIMRKCTSDYKVPNTNLTLKEGTKVFISTVGVHRDKDYYTDPEKFIPERFTEENKAKRPQFSYLPFGEGPRICIGMRFGLLQTKTGISMLVNKYRILPAKGDTYEINFEPRAFNLCKEGDMFLNAEIL